MLPSIVSQLVVILKDSALGYNDRLPRAAPQGQNLASLKGNLIPTLIVLAAIYIIINYALTRLARDLERRLQTRRRGPKRAELQPMMSPRIAPGGALTAPGSGLTSGLGCSGLPDDRHLDLAGVGQLLLDLLGDIPGQAPAPRCRRRHRVPP